MDENDASLIGRLVEEVFHVAEKYIDISIARITKPF